MPTLRHRHHAREVHEQVVVLLPEMPAPPASVLLTAGGSIPCETDCRLAVPVDATTHYCELPVREGRERATGGGPPDEEQSDRDLLGGPTWSCASPRSTPPSGSSRVTRWAAVAGGPVARTASSTTTSGSALPGGFAGTSVPTRPFTSSRARWRSRERAYHRRGFALGDAALFRAGTWATWYVPKYVRKHAILRRELPGPIRRQLAYGRRAKRYLGRVIGHSAPPVTTCSRRVVSRTTRRRRRIGDEPSITPCFNGASTWWAPVCLDGKRTDDRSVGRAHRSASLYGPQQPRGGGGAGRLRGRRGRVHSR